MRGIWEAMRDYANPCSVLTKSPLLLRDLDLMKELVQVTEFTAALSVPTLEEKAWRATEPHTPHPRKRIEAVAKLNAAGIPTGVLIAPLIPGINDHPEQVKELVDLCAEAGATAHQRDRPTPARRGQGHLVRMAARATRPELVPRYEELYGSRAYLPSGESKRLNALVKPPELPQAGNVPAPAGAAGIRSPHPQPSLAAPRAASSRRERLSRLEHAAPEVCPQTARRRRYHRIRPGGRG